MHFRAQAFGQLLHQLALPLGQRGLERLDLLSHHLERDRLAIIGLLQTPLLGLGRSQPRGPGARHRPGAANHRAAAQARVTLLACDTHICQGAPWVFEPWEEFRCPAEIQGGGGTDFRPVFEWLDGAGERPELLVYFTDAQGQFPENEPNYPVIWLVKGRETVPWGQRIQLN